jgi:homoserine kinase
MKHLNFKNIFAVMALILISFGFKSMKPNNYIKYVDPFIGSDFGFEIEIYKKIKPGSGVGSSSASAAGSVYGMNVLLGSPYTPLELASFAIKGEAVASQSEHADNIAPALYGGFTLVKSLEPLEILQIPTPDDLFAVVIHPQIEIKTADARKILPKEINPNHYLPIDIPGIEILISLFS